MPKSSSSGSNSQIQKARKKQIEKLKQQRYNVTVLHTDVQYKVEFPVKSKNTTTYYSTVISLPPNFPNVPPVLFVQPPCSHECLDPAQLVVNLQALENFKKKPDLSSVVKHLILEFEKSPPIPLVLNDFEQKQQEEILRSYTTPYLPAVRLDASIPLPSTQSQPVKDELPAVPNIQDIIPELDNLSIQELRDLDGDETQLLALIQGTELAKKISKEREEISQRVEAIAEENLSMSENLQRLRNQLMSKYATCEKLKAEYENNIVKFSEVSEWMTLPNLSLTLQVSAAEQEQAAEKLVEDFLDGNTDVSVFMKEFLKSKSLATVRKYKQGQYADKKIREYFYFIDHQGQLFLDDTKVKNFITCFKDKAFLEFFFKRLRRNSTGYYEETFPYLSLCGRERNYIRCDDTPIVYTHLMEVPSTDKSLRHALSYCGADEKLIVPFKPETLCMLPDTGRVYHEAKDKFGGIGLVKSSLAIELSAGFQFDSYNELLNGAEAAAPPTTFCWNGNEYSLTNEHVHRLTHRNRS